MELSEERKTNGTDFYRVTESCKNCGSSNIAVRYVESNGSMQQLCVDCGYWTNIPKIKNWNERVSNTIIHWSYHVRKRDKNTCFICGKRSDDNEAHHIIPVSHLDSKTQFLKDFKSNGLTLCKGCHWLVHNKADGSYSYQDFISLEKEIRND